MKVSVETVSPIEKKLVIEVDADRVEKELARAYVGLSRQVKVPGFRAGKVPRRILETRYKEQVEQDVVEHIVSHTYREAVDEHSLYPVGNPVVSPDKLEQGKPFKFEARVEVKPEVVAKDYRGIEWSAPKAEVKDSMIDDELERMRQSLAQLVPVNDRQAALEGDYAVIDFVGTLEGKEFEGGKGEGVTVEVNAGTMLEGMAPFLKGVSIGEKAETEVEFPPDFQDAALRAKKARFEVTLKGLKKKEIPAIDDELAKDLGGEAKTLEALKAQIKERLLKAEESRVNREARDQLLQALIAKNTFDVPKALVERAIDMMMTSAAERFQRQGLDIRQLGLDFKKLREDLRGKAVEEVKGALLLEAIADQEKLAVTDEDLSAYYTRVAGESGMKEPQVRAYFEKNAEDRNAMKSRLREDKALELVKREAKAKA